MGPNFEKEQKRTMNPLKILISNDDGVFAEGIRTLAIAAASRGHEVTVVCPDQERSATGHGLTLQAPIRAERADGLFGEGIKACLLYTSPSPRDATLSRMPSSA